MEKILESLNMFTKFIAKSRIGITMSMTWFSMLQFFYVQVLTFWVLFHDIFILIISFIPLVIIALVLIQYNSTDVLREEMKLKAKYIIEMLEQEGWNVTKAESQQNAMKQVSSLSSDY